MSWLEPGEKRIGLGCMRLSTEPDRDEARGEATIAAALDAGITVFDTARAYGLGEEDCGHNERLLARAIAAAGAATRVRIVTKGGMRRPEGRWAPDGRARSILADCEQSLEALGGLPIDLYLLHAPDPETPFATSVRALAQLLDRGLVKRVGLSNITAAQLDEALGIAPIAAVESSLGWLDDAGLRSGLVARCLARGVAFLAHRPLGGVKRRRGISRDEDLRAIAERHGATPARVALAAVLDLHPAIVALPGASRPETARDAAAASDLAPTLDDGDRARLARRLDRRFVSAPRAPEKLEVGEVVLLMGLQGSGKTDSVTSWTGRGYERLSRDERGGTMKTLHRHLDSRLAAGVRQVVLDNTYVVRATRREAIEVAWKHRLGVRGVWHDTPLAQAQVNVVLRMVRHHGRLLAPGELNGAGPTALPPHAQHCLLRQLEPPALDEGYAALDVVPFVRRPSPDLRPGRFVALDALVDAGGRVRDGFAVAIGEERETPRLVFAWRPDRRAPIDDLAARILDAAPGLPIFFAECVHPAGPAICWCRPPMPGLPVAFAVAHGLDLARSTLAGASPAHRAMAEAMGAAYVG